MLLKNLYRLYKDEQGQAVVEYILMVAMVISVVAIVATSFRKSIRMFWLLLTKEIAAACPDCPPPTGS